MHFYIPAVNSVIFIFSLSYICKNSFLLSHLYGTVGGTTAIPFSEVLTTAIYIASRKLLRRLSPTIVSTPGIQQILNSFHWLPVDIVLCLGNLFASFLGSGYSSYCI